jgi:hypothetical protein
MPNSDIRMASGVPYSRGGKRAPDERDLAGQDPEEVLRRMLAISPEDAEQVRKHATEKAAPKD